MAKNSSAGNIFLGVFAIATVRDFLEVALEGKSLIHPEDPLYSLKNYFLHFNSFYFLVFATLSLILYLFARKKTTISNCLKIGALAMTLIWIGPLFDYFVSGHFDMFYPSDPMNVVRNLHHLADFGYEYDGLSKGMRIEILLAGMGAIGYLWYKTRKLFTSIIGGACISLACLAIGLLIPFVTQLYEYGFNFGDHKLYNSTLLHQGFVVHGTGSKIALLYLFLCLILFSIAYYIRSSKRFLAIINNFRWTRAMHYLLLFFGGLLLMYHHPPVFSDAYDGDFSFLTTIGEHPFDLFGIFMAALAIFLSFESAVIFNDIYDYDIDRVCNVNRPLVNNTVSLSEYNFLAKLFAISAITIAFCISEAFFFLVLLYHLLAFLYSVPPFRLRRYFMVSNIELATIFLLTFHAGATVLISKYRFDHIPTFVTFGLLISYTLAVAAKDAKDHEGDKTSHVQTLYTLLGRKAANVITVLLVCCSILLTPLLLHVPQLLWFSIPICLLFVLTTAFIKNDKSKEIVIVALYFFFLLVLLHSLIS